MVKAASRSTSITATLALCGLVVAACLLGATHARATIYWVNSTNGSGGTIGSSTNSGTEVNQSFVTGAAYPRGVAANSTHVFWTNAWTNPATIGRAELNGSNVQQSFITDVDLSGAESIAVDSEFVYWTNADTHIGRARLDGSDVTPLWLPLGNDPAISRVTGVDVNASHLYFSLYGSTRGDGSLGRANRDGTGLNTGFVPNLYRPTDVAVNSSGIFWVDNQDKKVGRSELNGAGADPDLISLSGTGPWGLAAGSDKLLISRFANPGSIDRANLDGTGLETGFIAGANFPQGVFITEPGAGLSPASSGFGAVTVGSGSSVTRSFTLTSTGVEPLTIDPGGVTISESLGANFGLAGGSCLVGSPILASGQSCTVDVRFAPDRAGSKEATLSVATSAGTRTASLSGTAVDPPAPGPSPVPVPSAIFSGLRFSPSAKSASAPTRGSKGVTLKIRVTNRGDASGTAEVGLRSSSRYVKVPKSVRFDVRAGATASKSFKASVSRRARGKVRITARLADGSTAATLSLRVRR